jgi:phage terminase Nu1 subunit (DNA packaging protein)
MVSQYFMKNICTGLISFLKAHPHLLVSMATELARALKNLPDTDKEEFFSVLQEDVQKCLASMEKRLQNLEKQ